MFTYLIGNRSHYSCVHFDFFVYFLVGFEHTIPGWMAVYNDHQSIFWAYFFF